MGTAEAIKDHIKDWYFGSGEYYTTMAVITDEECYGIPKGIGFSLPCITDNFDYKIVNDLELDEFTLNKLKMNYEEIKEELKSIDFSI